MIIDYIDQFYRGNYGMIAIGMLDIYIKFNTKKSITILKHINMMKKWQ